MMQHTSVRLVLGALAITGALMNATTARAQDDAFRTGQVSVLKAANFIDDYHNGDYTYGSPLAMTVQEDALKRWAGKRIQARIFVLDSSGTNRPDKWLSVLNCDVFYTFVIPIGRLAANGRLNLGRVNSLGWMRMPDGGLAQGRFLVVFESATNDDPVFRLHRADRESYFSRGVIITATHASGASAAAPSIGWLASDERRRRKEIKQISSDRTCYRFQIADQTNPWAGPVARLERCFRDHSGTGARRQAG